MDHIDVAFKLDRLLVYLSGTNTDCIVTDTHLVKDCHKSVLTVSHTGRFCQVWVNFPALYPVMSLNKVKVSAAGVVVLFQDIANKAKEHRPILRLFITVIYMHNSITVTKTQYSSL